MASRGAGRCRKEGGGGWGHAKLPGKCWKMDALRHILSCFNPHQKNALNAMVYYSKLLQEMIAKHSPVVNLIFKMLYNLADVQLDACSNPPHGASNRNVSKIYKVSKLSCLQENINLIISSLQAGATDKLRSLTNY